jgi:AcrR family transcriptional regulator
VGVGVNPFPLRQNEVMAPPVRVPRTKWIEEGLAALAMGGPDAVRIEALAASMRVSKGGFYWHFKNRDALLDEMLDTWERQTTDEVIAKVEAQGGTARAKLRRTFALTSSMENLFAVDLAIRTWSRRDPSIRRRLRKLDNRRMTYLRSLFSAFCTDPDDIEVRCMLSFSLLIGDHLITADHKSHNRADVVNLALRRLGA